MRRTLTAIDLFEILTHWYADRCESDVGRLVGALLDQRNGDLLAFRQRQRRTWHASVSIGRSRSLVPVIMTGTVHRLMELTRPACRLQGR